MGPEPSTPAEWAGNSVTHLDHRVCGKCPFAFAKAEPMFHPEEG